MFRSVGWAIECTHRLGWAVACLPCRWISSLAAQRLAILRESGNAIIIIILVISFRRRLHPLERNADVTSSVLPGVQRSALSGAARGCLPPPASCLAALVCGLLLLLVFSSLYLFSFFIGTWEALFGPASPRPTRDRGRDGDGSQEPSVRTRRPPRRHRVLQA